MAKLDLFLKGQNGIRPNLRGDLYNPANAFWEVQDSVNFLYDTGGVGNPYNITIISSNEDVPSINGSIVHPASQTPIGATNTGWLGPGLYVRRNAETQDQREARLADPENIEELAAYRYLGPPGYRTVEYRTTGLTYNQYLPDRYVIINAVTPQNVTFPNRLIRDEQENSQTAFKASMYGILRIAEESSDVTLVVGNNVTPRFPLGYVGNVLPKKTDIIWHYIRINDTASELIISFDTPALETEIDFIISTAEDVVDAPSVIPPSMAWGVVVDGVRQQRTIRLTANGDDVSHTLPLLPQGSRFRFVIDGDNTADVRLVVERISFVEIAASWANDTNGGGGTSIITLAVADTLNIFEGDTFFVDGTSATVIARDSSTAFRVQGELGTGSGNITVQTRAARINGLRQ